MGAGRGKTRRSLVSVPSYSDTEVTDLEEEGEAFIIHVGPVSEPGSHQLMPRENYDEISLGTAQEIVNMLLHGKYAEGIEMENSSEGITIYVPFSELPELKNEIEKLEECAPTAGVNVTCEFPAPESGTENPNKFPPLDPKPLQLEDPGIVNF